MPVQAAVEDDRQLISTQPARSRGKAGYVHIIAQAYTHFRPFDSHVRANCIAVTILAAKIEYGIFYIFVIMAGV